MRDAWSSMHPGVQLGYFAVVIAVSMLVMHPAVLGISLGAGVLYALYLRRVHAVRLVLTTAVPMLALFTFVNPLLNHAGATVVATLLGMPLTLEALAYGLAAGCMFVAVIVWFYCANAVMTSDAVLYLFGRVAPSFALLVTMVVRMVPRLGRQARRIMRAQRGVGCDAGEGSLFVRAHRGLRVVSMLTSWALENAIDTADSMRARGFGLPGRSTYAAFRLTMRDVVLALCVAILGGCVCWGVASGAAAVTFFPLVAVGGEGSSAAVLYGAWAVLCLLPLMVDGWEELTWMRLTSRV